MRRGLKRLSWKSVGRLLDRISYLKLLMANYRKHAEICHLYDPNRTAKRIVLDGRQINPAWFYAGEKYFTQFLFHPQTFGHEINLLKIPSDKLASETQWEQHDNTQIEIKKRAKFYY